MDRDIVDLSSVDTETASTELACEAPNLNKESLELINKIIAEKDVQKARELTYLFNLNQNKKTMVRVNKLSELLDTITDQALTRLTTKPDEISNKELFDGLKTVQDLIERGQRQVSGPVEVPLIQVNNQTNEVNIGNTSLNRDSRERVKSAVLNLLGSIAANQACTDSEVQDIDDEASAVDEIITVEE